MKNTLILLIFTIVTSFSCKDKSLSCEQTNAPSILVGEWTETKIGDLGDEVTFNEDNTGTCSETSIFYFDPNFNGTTTSFTWSVNSDNDELTMHARWSAARHQETATQDQP